jgi:putative transposase
MTCTVVGWIDVFTREAYRQTIIDSLDYCQKHKGLHVKAWVIMTNHIHLIAWVEAPFEMNQVMRDFKRHTAMTILKQIETNQSESRKEQLLHNFGYFGSLAKNRENYQFWQDGFHPIELWSDQVILQKLNYLHQNPVASGFVSEPQHWRYSSAIDYAEGKGLLDIDLWWPSAFITVK